MGVFEDGESLFSPRIVVEKDQDRPGGTLFKVGFHLHIH